jgi:N-acetylneuraminic acid mutarotase
MSKSVTAMLVLFFMIASCIVVAKPALSFTDVVEDSWVPKAPMQQARAGLGVVAVNGKIYAIGGTTASGQYPPDGYRGGFVGTNEEYDPATNTWTTKASMPTPRDYFAIAAYQNKIYCIGGAVGFTAVEGKPGFYSYVTSGVNEVYDTVTGTWETKTPMPFNGMKLRANVVNNKIYVMQGFYMHVYDPASDSWTDATTMPATPRQGSGFPPLSVVVDNKIIVTGEFQTGYPLHSEQKILIYDTETDSWSEGRTGPTIVVGGAAGATTGANALQRVYVLGLEYGQFPPPSTNQVYDPKTDAWTTANAMPTLRTGFGVAVVDDMLYAIGGYSYVSLIYGTVTPVAVNEQYTPIGYGVPPEIKVVSPEKQTYNGSSVSLVFTVNKPVNWTGYSLDGQDNVTITSNTTLPALTNGLHNLTVYANDTFGNMGASETISFSVEVPFPTALVATVSAASVIIAGVGLLVYFKKRKH